MTPSHGSDTMVHLAAALSETKERRCPGCQNESVAPANHLLAIEDRLVKLIKEEFRCAVCGTAFWIVRTEGASGGPRSEA